jgi:peptidoglycan/LPS O-acetylase OafA/YrhL
MHLVNDIMWVLLVAVLVMAVYAFVHAAIQRSDAYTAAEKLTKPVWLAILGGAVAFSSIHGHCDLGLRRWRVSGRRAAQTPGNSGQVALTR